MSSHEKREMQSDRGADAVRSDDAEKARISAVAMFVADAFGARPSRTARIAAFEANFVYEVDAARSHYIVKATSQHRTARFEAWTCDRVAKLGYADTAILARGRLRTEQGESVFAMRRIVGNPIQPLDPLLGDAGAWLRQLHTTTMAGFGWLAEATDAGGQVFGPQAESPDVHTDPPLLKQRTWRGFLDDLCHDLLELAPLHPRAQSLFGLLTDRIGSRSEALAAVTDGALCHGDLKPSHILVHGGRIASVIDWGDAVVADPIWDLARYAHRVDKASAALLLRGYDPAGKMNEDLAWRLPLYSSLWNVVDAVVSSRVGIPLRQELAIAERCLR